MTQLFWSPETKNCFLKAKQAIEKATVLAHPNHEANLKLITDASDSAVGAVLQQISNGLRQPLAFLVQDTHNIHGLAWSDSCLLAMR